jgi:hypothetical protein
MTLHEWITWAFGVAETPHRFAAYVLARQASRDLGAEVTEAQFEEAMARAGFVVHHHTQHGSARYLATDSPAKRIYDFHRFVLVDPIDHPLNEPNRPDPLAAFKALPADEQAAMLDWIKASVVPIRRTRTLSSLRFPCAVVTCLAINDEAMRGALLTAGIKAVGYRFHCGLTDEALAKFRRARRGQAFSLPNLQASQNPSSSTLEPYRN